jgi:hypothetical protein
MADSVERIIKPPAALHRVWRLIDEIGLAPMRRIRLSARSTDGPPTAIANEVLGPDHECRSAWGRETGMAARWNRHST